MSKQSFLSLFILLFIVHGALGQDNNNSPYKFSSEIFDHISKDSNYLNSSAPTDLSFIGLYRDALIQYDKPRHAGRIISAKDSADFLSYHPVDARKFIIEKAKKNQVLIFNEAHYNPRNRVFVTSLLKDLRDLGYKYFAAETFVNDSFFAKDKHPNFFTGYYTAEPQFGNLVREALKLNYSLYPYEAVPPANGKQREIQEAKNLQLLLQKDPKAKVIVYCGYDHIIEDSLPVWGKAMAGRLKEFTTIDPYSIEQIILSERSENDAESPYFKLVDASNYSILQDRNGNTFNNHKVDALLYSPPTKYIYNRPNWVFENDKAPYFLNSKDIRLLFPIIVKTYMDSDDLKKSISVDVIEIRSQADVSKTGIALFDKGHFIIKLVDASGQTQIIKVDK